MDLGVAVEVVVVAGEVVVVVMAMVVVVVVVMEGLRNVDGEIGYLMYVAAKTQLGQ